MSENAKGARFVRLHRRCLSSLNCSARSIWVTGRSSSPRSTSRRSPRWHWHLVHGRWLVHRSRPRGCSSAPTGGSGRIEICVEAMSEGSRDASSRLSARYPRIWMCDCVDAGAAGKAVLVFSTASHGEVPGNGGAVHGTVHGVQAAAAVPRSEFGDAAVRRAHTAAGAGADPRRSTSSRTHGR